MGFKEKAKQLKLYIPAFWLAMKRKDTPLMAKILAAITIGYALSPIDLIPDFIPVLGYLDDLIILALLAALTLKCIPTFIMTECLTESKNIWQNGKPKAWYHAIPIVIIWLIILFYIGSIFI